MMAEEHTQSASSSSSSISSSMIDASSFMKEKHILVIANVSKRNNIISLLYSAAAFGFYPVIVGAPAIKSEGDLLLLEPRCSFSRFDTLVELRVWLDSKTIPLVGVEIMAEAVSLLDTSNAFPSCGMVALMPGNEGTGLSEHQKSVCNSFIYVPQYGHSTASLNVNVATTIIMQKYKAWWWGTRDRQVREEPS